MMDWSTWMLAWFYVAGLVPAFITGGIMMHPIRTNLYAVAVIAGALLWPVAAVIFTILFLADVVMELAEDVWDDFVEMLHGT